MLGILKKCFSLNLNEYDNININLEINVVVFFAFFALAIGVVFLNLYRGNIRLCVSQLLRHEAVGKESAKTLASLKLADSKIVKFLLCGDTLLTKIVARSGEKTYTYEEYKALSNKDRKEKIDFEIETFYIREDKLYQAKGMIDKYATSVMRTVFTCVFIGLICICIMACMPGILNVINNLLERG